MSQTKAVMKTINISLDQIKPSPYQPRLSFNLEDIRGSIQRDGILVPLTVREKDGYYELVDGERRTRLAKELGYKTVPVTVIDVDDDTARRMVWKVNTLRQEYSPKEKAYYFKKLQEEYGMSLRGIARECDYSEDSVVAHLNVLQLPEKYQNLVWDGLLSVSHVRMLRPYFNGDALMRAHAIELLDQIIEKKLTANELQETIKPELKEIEERRIEATREAVKEVIPTPEKVKLETPEQLEKAAVTLRREAKKKREEILTPKEKARLEAEKKLKEEERRQREQERKRREDEEIGKRLEVEKRKIEEEARKKVREEILSSPETMREMVAEVESRVSSQETVEIEERARQSAEEILQPLKEAIIKAEADIQEAESSEKRKLLQNYMVLGSILTLLRDKRVFCLDHPNEQPMLMWSCGTSLSKTYDQLKERMRTS